jgi:hypothetical protein
LIIVAINSISNEAPAGNVGGMTMAQVDHWEDGDGGLDLDPFYNVTMAVGPAGTAPNRRDDVLLVQYFLTNVAGTLDYWVPPRTDRPLQVDGRMGSDTAAWIKSYQNSMTDHTTRDGRIDRALGASGSISGKRYTILFLNHHFQLAQPTKFAALEDDTEAPDELRMAIKLSRARGSKGIPYVSPGIIT